MKAFLHGLEVFVIGIGVVAIGGIIEAFANYHPTGEAASIWAVVSVFIIGALKGAYSWLVTKRDSAQ